MIPFSSLVGTWSDVGLTLVIAVIVYASLIVLLRVVGKRSVGKWDASDLIVTVALGSTLATAVVSRTVPLLTGLTALVALIALQFLINWWSVRSDWFRRLVHAHPTLLVRDGRMLLDVMKSQRASESDVLAALRHHGIGDLREVAAVVLEIDGSISVIVDVPQDAAHSTLRDVDSTDATG